MRGGRSLEFAVFALADRLSKSVVEIGAMTMEEFHGWHAYVAVLAEKKKGT